MIILQTGIEINALPYKYRKRLQDISTTITLYI